MREVPILYVNDIKQAFPVLKICFGLQTTFPVLTCQHLKYILFFLTISDISEIPPQVFNVRAVEEAVDTSLNNYLLLKLILNSFRHPTDTLSPCRSVLFLSPGQYLDTQLLNAPLC